MEMCVKYHNIMDIIGVLGESWSFFIFKQQYVAKGNIMGIQWEHTTPRTI